MTFSAEEIRDWHLKQVEEALDQGWEADPNGAMHQQMADALTAMLEQRDAVTDWAVPDDDSCDVNEEGSIFTAGIDVADAKGKVWMNRIECHGYTEKEAHALRNEVMASRHARQVPIAWSIRWVGDTRLNLSTVFDTEQEAQEWVDKSSPGGQVVALYAAPPTPSENDHCRCAACLTIHASDCAVHNMPAMPNGHCDCGAAPSKQIIENIVERETGGLRNALLRCEQNSAIGDKP